MKTDNAPQIPDDKRKYWEKYGASAGDVKDLLSTIAKAEAALAAAWAENAALGQEFLAYFYSLLTDKPLSDGTWPHLAICSGDRRVKPGTRGNSCCCQPIWLKENDELRATLARVGAKVTEWISVEERLPAYDTDVLLWAPDWPHVFFGYFRHSDEWIGRFRAEMSNGLPNTDPTHWQPLPEPPARIAPPQPGSKA